MPLLGLVDGERVVSSLLTADEWDTLKADIKAKRRTVVLPCGFPGHGKTSRLGTQYFAHNPGGDGCSAGETAEHLLAKATIVEAAIAAGWDAQPEARGDGWIADVLATKNGVQVVFEVQWSHQDLPDYWARQQRYKAVGVASCAWFARHTDGLPTTDKNLPIFGLTVPGNATPTVKAGEQEIPLADAVTRLLTRRLQHRDYIYADQPSEATIKVTDMGCYRCSKKLGVWLVTRLTIPRRCGDPLTSRPHGPTFPTSRLEAIDAVVGAASDACQRLGVTPARLSKRRTQASGTTYMAFICPHCNATQGEMFVQDEFNRRDGTTTTTSELASRAHHRPHWCVAGTDGTCLIPSPDYRERLETQRIESDKAEREQRQQMAAQSAPAQASVMTVTPANMNQVVRKMLRGW